MTKTGRLVRLPSALGLTAVLSLGGCIPRSGTVILSPPIRGYYERSDGTPIAGASVVVSTLVADSTCAYPAASTTTDAAGRFKLPATTGRNGWVLITAHYLESLYRVCVGHAEMVHVAYQGSRRTYPTNDPDPAPLVLNCVEAPLSQDNTLIRCTRH